MKNLLLLLSACFSYAAFCQNVGVGTTAPKNKLHIAGGLRVDTLVSGLDSGILRHDKNGVVYSLKFTNNANDVLRGNGTFAPAGGGSTGWSLTGNSGTNPTNNFIGTTDNKPLKFRANNLPAGMLDPIDYNTSFGVLTLASNTLGQANSAMGFASLSSNTTGLGNTAFGANALNSNSIGNNNTGIGAYSLYSNSVGDDNTALGKNALFNNIGGAFNTAVGKDALLDNVVGFHNSAFGGGALASNISGSSNTALGIRALYSNTTGYSNVAVGTDALRLNTTRSNLVAIGDSALYSNTIGTGNTAIGSKAMYLNASGIDNTAIGAHALNQNSTGSGNIAVGSSTLLDNTTGSLNVAVGVAALNWNLIGNNNIAVGTESLRFNGGGNNNIAIGSSALRFNNSGYSNIAIGKDALFKNIVGSNLVAIGDSALYNNADPQWAIGNTAIGSKSLFANTSGPNNTAIGYNSLKNNVLGNDNTAVGLQSLWSNTGSYNTAIGSSSNFSNQTGHHNTAVGYNAGVEGSGNLKYATAIGAGAKVTASNSLVLGGTGANAVKVGIGVTSPIVTLHVKGTANFFSGADTHTGEFYAGTSNFDGIELASSLTDAYASIQRTSNYGLHISKKNVASNNGLVGFLVNGLLVGSITTNGTNTSFNTTSDIRLKENIIATHYGLNTLMKIKVEDYNYKSDGKKMLYTGFMAQELFTLYPQAVQPGGENARTNPWMIDYSKITPLLVKSIQDQQHIIESQQQQLKELNEKIDLVTELYNALIKK